MNFYDSGFPYSDELYHHGIKNQKWGLRRYQNEDGSLTALGRIHYGVGKARESLSTKMQNAKAARDLAYKRKHLDKMSIEELSTELKRQQLLSSIGTEKRTQKFAKRDTERAKKVASDILESGAKTLATKGFNALASKIFDEKTPAVRGLAEVLADEKSTIQEIRDAKEKFKTAVEYNSQKAYNEYIKNFNNQYMSNFDPKSKPGDRKPLPTNEDLALINERAKLLKDISGFSGGNGQGQGGGKKKKGNNQ